MNDLVKYFLDKTVSYWEEPNRITRAKLMKEIFRE